MRSDALIVIGMIAGSLFAAGCAIVGYDLDGYGPASGGAANGGGGNGGANTSSTSRTSTGTSGGGGGVGGHCADTETCAETPPTGFHGPVALLVDQPTATCKGDFPDEVFTGGGSPQGDPASCTCTCDTTPCAQYVTVTSYTDAACSTGPATYSLSNTGSCNSVAPTGTVHVIVTPPKATGTCQASAPTVKTTPPSFGSTVVACGGAARGADCGSGNACYPKPKAPFDTELCIYKTGDVACPHGLTKKVYFEAFTDGRGCGACACGPAATTCPTAASFFSDTACATPVGAPPSGACSALAGVWGSAEGKIASPCTPIPGMPDGEVTGAEPTTFCCD